MAKKNSSSRKRAELTSSNRVTVDPIEVLLDPQNPRLAFEDQQRGLSQGQLLQLVVDLFSLDELAESIILSGYIPYEPIVCAAEDGEYVVLEGNRRIATLKLLLNPELAPIKQRSKWQKYQQRLQSNVLASLHQIPAVIVPDRASQDVLAFIGFRHATGVKDWDAAEKAKYMAFLIDHHQWDYQRVAEALGSRPHHVEKHYIAYRMVRQAADLEVEGADCMEESFGVLMRAIQASGVAEFMQINLQAKDPSKSQVPVPSTHIDSLKDFVRWTFGTDEVDKIVKESRDLTKWGRILQSEKAVRYLRNAGHRANFNRAYQKSGGETESLCETLETAANRLEECVALVEENKDDDSIQEAFGNVARFFSKVASSFPTQCKTHGIKLGPKEDA